MNKTANMTTIMPTSVLATLILVSVTVLNFATAQQRPTLTPEQLERVRIQPVPGKNGLYIIPGLMAVCPAVMSRLESPVTA